MTGNAKLSKQTIIGIDSSSKQLTENVATTQTGMQYSVKNFFSCNNQSLTLM